MLNDITIIFSTTAKSDEGYEYPILLRLDYEGTFEEFKRNVENIDGVRHSELLVAEE